MYIPTKSPTGFGADLLIRHATSVNNYSEDYETFTHQTRVADRSQ